MRAFKDTFDRYCVPMALWGIFTATSTAVLWLYDVIIEPAIYAAILSFFFLTVAFSISLIKENKREHHMSTAILSMPAGWRDLPQASTACEMDYQQIISILGNSMEKMANEFDSERQSSLDYYTAWVHQIKTPIAVMKLKLSEDTPENTALSAELFRIERYVDMVLLYSRLGSTSNDLVIHEYSLDDLIRKSVRKYAPQFIEKKLALSYETTNCTIITDQKWFECILDQLLSNAIKYTTSGTVSIVFSEGLLSVSDTGIGIPSEDLPRIFEKGYTGNNGRQGANSTGLGLYLAGQASVLLNIPISVSGEPGVGSKFTLDLRNKIIES